MEKEFKNELGTNNEVGVVDDIGVDMIKRNLGALYSELEAYKEAAEVAHKSYINYKEQWEIDARLFELEMEHFGKIDDSKSSHKIELLPEFWELQKKKKGFVIRQETFSAEKSMEGLLEDFNNSQERIEILEKQISELTIKLEAEGEVVNKEELMRDFQ